MKDSFIALQEEWYRRLRDAGFEDIEEDVVASPGHRSRRVIVRREIDTRRAHVRDFEAVRQYYTTAEKFLHRHRRQNRFERKIWASHCEGKSVRCIAGELKTNVTATWRTIERVRETAGLLKRGTK